MRSLYSTFISEAQNYANKSGVTMWVRDNIEYVTRTFIFRKDNITTRIDMLPHYMYDAAELLRIAAKVRTIIDLLAVAHTQPLHGL